MIARQCAGPDPGAEDCDHLTGSDGAALEAGRVDDSLRGEFGPRRLQEFCHENIVAHARAAGRLGGLDRAWRYRQVLRVGDARDVDTAGGIHRHGTARFIARAAVEGSIQQVASAGVQFGEDDLQTVTVNDLPLVGIRRALEIRGGVRGAHDVDVSRRIYRWRCTGPILVPFPSGIHVESAQASREDPLALRVVLDQPGRRPEAALRPVRPGGGREGGAFEIAVAYHVEIAGAIHGDAGRIVISITAQICAPQSLGAGCVELEHKAVTRTGRSRLRRSLRGAQIGARFASIASLASVSS